MSALHDKAFDTGLIALDDEFRVLVSSRLKRHAAHDFMWTSLIAQEGRRIALPERWWPDAKLLRWHRETLFAA